LQRIMCKSKIHRARVTDANLHYAGSLTIDKELIKAAGLVPYEQIHVVNINNGSRAETYVIEGPANSGMVCANGALARLVHKDDVIIIISYALYDDKELANYQPIVVQVDQHNKILS
jgi:aspartate 1-decarboxylase